jgi:hypothetical protein
MSFLSRMHARRHAKRAPAKGRPYYQLVLELDRARADPLAGLDPKTRHAWREAAIEWRADPESPEDLGLLDGWQQ